MGRDWETWKTGFLAASFKFWAMAAAQETGSMDHDRPPRSDRPRHRGVAAHGRAAGDVGPPPAFFASSSARRRFSCTCCECVSGATCSMASGCSRRSCVCRPADPPMERPPDLAPRHSLTRRRPESGSRGTGHQSPRMSQDVTFPEVDGSCCRRTVPRIFTGGTSLAIG